MSWSSLRSVQPCITAPALFNVCVAYLYGSDDARYYVEVVLQTVSGDPCVRILACRGSDSEVSDPLWVANRFRHFGSGGDSHGDPLPLPIIKDLLARLPDPSVSVYWGFGL